MQTTNQVPIASLISYLRSELIKAGEGAVESSVKFETLEIELELQVGVSKTVESEAGIELYVFSLGAEGGFQKEQIQTIKLKLKPTDAKGGKHFTADDSKRG